MKALAVSEEILLLIRAAVREDVGTGDRTAEAAIPAGLRTEGRVVARRAGVLSGGCLVGAILREYDQDLKFEMCVEEGGRVEENETVARVWGSARMVLSAERTLLNFLGHLSGIATMTARYVDAVADVRPRPTIVDTRKTTPGYRALDKYAVRCGGGVNHRMGLYDGVMLKDNHLAALRSRGEETLAQVTRRIREGLEPSVLLWLEVDTLEQLAEALPGGGADIILLDNFGTEELRAAVGLRNAMREKSGGQSSTIGAYPLLEASGGVTLANVHEVAETGVDRIAIGALTHSAPVLDLSMEFE